MVPLLNTIGQAEFRQILQAAIAQLAGKEIPPEELKALQKALKVEGNAFATIFTGCWTVMKNAVKNRTKLQVIETDLTKMNVPAAIVKDFAKAVRGSRFDLEQAAVKQQVRFPKLDGIQWRVDVGISTSALQKALQPSVMMQMTLSNGSIKTFEVPLDQFHLLRYNTAKALQDMGQVSRHPMMRISFEQDKARFDKEQKEKLKFANEASAHRS
jgi:hypothetical protein